MTTVTTDQELGRRMAELDAMAAQEWAAYGERLKGLEGREYETAEATAWDELRGVLDALEAEREGLSQGQTPASATD